MKKSAILFGINNYHDCPLKNAANDASALSEKLTELGFEAKSRLYVSILKINLSYYFPAIICKT